MRSIVFALYLLAVCGCSTQAVTVTTLRPYGPKTLGDMKPALIEGIWGFFGKGVATAICGVDGKAFDTCVIAVELPPGEHQVDVRLILGAATIHRTYGMQLEEAGTYQVVPKKMDDGSEEPVIRFHKFRD
jgi:hypothetical protein